MGAIKDDKATRSGVYDMSGDDLDDYDDLANANLRDLGETAEPQTVRAAAPRNLQRKPAPKKKQPNSATVLFEVRTRGVEKFRRAGLMFTGDPVNVEASSLNREQKIELLNTPTLSVRELGPAPPAKTVTAPPPGKGSPGPTK